MTCGAHPYAPPGAAGRCVGNEKAAAGLLSISMPADAGRPTDLTEPKRCECCGQIIPPEVDWPWMKQRIWDAICERPRTFEQLMWVLWGADPDGGPTTQNLRLHIHQMNKRLICYGVKIKARPGKPYCVVPA